MRTSPAPVSHTILSALSRHVPPAVPGVFFLSGGQTEEMATDNLRAINRSSVLLARPWLTSFCYGRALQDSCRAVWLGRQEKVKEAQQAFITRLRLNGEAL